MALVRLGVVLAAVGVDIVAHLGEPVAQLVDVSLYPTVGSRYALLSDEEDSHGLGLDALFGRLVLRKTNTSVLKMHFLLLLATCFMGGGIIVF